MRQKGFAPILLILIVLAVGIAGFAGYKINFPDLLTKIKNKISTTKTSFESYKIPVTPQPRQKTIKYSCDVKTSKSLPEVPYTIINSAQVNGWKMFKGKYYSFSYPANWILKSYNSGVGLDQAVNLNSPTKTAALEILYVLEFGRIEQPSEKEKVDFTIGGKTYSVKPLSYTPYDEFIAIESDYLISPKINLNFYIGDGYPVHINYTTEEFDYMEKHLQDEKYKSEQFNLYLKDRETIKQILSTFDFYNTTNKEKVLRLTEEYLDYLITQNVYASLYLTQQAYSKAYETQSSETYWLCEYVDIKKWEILNEFHSQEEENRFFNREKVPLTIKLYKANDPVGITKTLNWEATIDGWKTPDWDLLD